MTPMWLHWNANEMVSTIYTVRHLNTTNTTYLEAISSIYILKFGVDGIYASYNIALHPITLGVHKACNCVHFVVANNHLVKLFHAHYGPSCSWSVYVSLYVWFHGTCNVLRTEIIWRNIEIYFAFPIIPRHWNTIPVPYGKLYISATIL